MLLYFPFIKGILKDLDFPWVDNLTSNFSVVYNLLREGVIQDKLGKQNKKESKKWHLTHASYIAIEVKVRTICEQPHRLVHESHQ